METGAWEAKEEGKSEIMSLKLQRDAVNVDKQSRDKRRPKGLSLL